MKVSINIEYTPKDEHIPEDHVEAMWKTYIYNDVMEMVKAWGDVAKLEVQVES